MTFKTAFRFSLPLLLTVAAQAQDRQPKPLPDGIVSVDTYSKGELQRMIEAGYRPEIPWMEAYGEFVDVNAYVPGLSVAEAYDYVQDTNHLAEWTISVRNIQPMGQLNGRNRVSATESMPPGGTIYLLEEKHPEVSTMEWWVGHSPDDIWMRYYIRILDAQVYMGKPGIIIDWVNFGHANFDRNPDLKQGFLGMKIAHAIERDNMIKILRWRQAGNTGPVDDAVSQELGLINLSTYPAMDIWNMVAAQVAPTVKWEQLYGPFISSHFYLVDQPVDKVWNYLKDPRNRDRWTVSMRNVIDVPGNGFLAFENLEPLGPAMAEQEISEASKTLDLRISSPRYYDRLGTTKWMTSTMRVLDGPESVGKPGSVVVWTTFHHAAYDVLPELSETWKFLPVRNAFAARNLALLLGVEP